MDNKILSKLKSKLNWSRALTALAIGFGTVGYLDSDAIATPVKDHFELAQVGVGSLITSPTPLNLRPRTHTPLPRSNSSYYPSRSYYPRGNTRYGRHHKYDHHHGDCHHSRHGHTRKNRRRTGGAVIIISPGNHREYGNYSNNGSYIRVLRK